MKKLSIFILFVALSTNIFAQAPTKTEKLYYTCKVWGYMKYFHSHVSACKINWNKILVENLTMIDQAVTKEEFNSALLGLMDEAGPMEIATTDPPEEIPYELRRNLDYSWFDDELLNEEVKARLNEIKKNFRPHIACWAVDNEGEGYGWLAFPYDDPIINWNANTTFPDENQRLMANMSFWNIMNYYNPNKYILETPWDSTLYYYIEEVAEAEEYVTFYRTFQKMTSNLDDAHTEGLTGSSVLKQIYAPKLLLKNIEDQYVVIKSGYPEIIVGDIIVSVDGKTTKQWEDSLRKYVSAGNTSVFKRFMNKYIIRGGKDTQIELEYMDENNEIHHFSTVRYDYYYSDWFLDYHASNNLKGVKWHKWDCNVGYVDMAKVLNSDVNEFMNELKNTKAIIFDLRYSNLDNTAWNISDLLYPEPRPFAILTYPDVNYPGTFEKHNQYRGFSEPYPDYYKGKVIILVDENTQSSMEYSTMMLKAAPEATIIGSQTAGADGNITAFFISKEISTGFSTLGVYWPDNRQTQGIGLVPDIEVRPTINGIRNNIDEVLETALDFAECNMSEVKEDQITESSISVYPNPSFGIINISDFSGNVKMFNIYGSIVFEKYVKQLETIDISNYPQGIYFIELLSKNDKYVKRITLYY
jgi:carboxyl-terminal processing protease